MRTTKAKLIAPIIEVQDSILQDKLSSYRHLLESKIIQTPATGFEVPKGEISDILFPYQKDIVHWALEGGRRAIFATFGRGKTIMQLELARLVVKITGMPFLIGLPLTVSMEFLEDAELLGVKVKYVRDQGEIEDSLYTDSDCMIFLSNYERIRTGNFNPDLFGGVSFDEGDAIRNLDTETTNYIMNNFNRIPFRFIATATPSPNEFTELLNYAQFLGVMDRGQALTRFFQRNSTTAGDLTLYPHKKKEFWFWVRSWAIFIKKPSDFGYEDDGMELPKLNLHYHCVKIKDRGDIMDRDGNYKMYRDTSKGIVEAGKEKRDSITERVQEMKNIIDAGNPDDHYLIWHHREKERATIDAILPGVKTVYGKQKLEEREANLLGFKNGEYKYLSTKPEIAGSGCNFQKHCHNAIFVGIDFRFKDFLQALHRIYRYLQTYDVNIHIIYTDAEEHVLKTMLKKWAEHNELEDQMTSLIKEFGLSSAKLVSELKRSIGVERKEESGKLWTAIHNDCVIELMHRATNSVGMFMTSIPFSDQYEYCESYNDMGHNDGDVGFFKQLDFLTPEMFRTLQPGRIAAIHVKDRIRFSYQNGVGMTSIIDFSGRTVAHFEKHGFHLMAKRTIPTDVVHENNGTYRLTYGEMTKDATKMGCGSPEYLLFFRKPPSDNKNAYADVPVTKFKNDTFVCPACNTPLPESKLVPDVENDGFFDCECDNCNATVNINQVFDTIVLGYSLGRWQLDADSVWRSSGNRLLNPEEIKGMSHKVISNVWKQVCEHEIYDYEKYVQICENLLANNKLPKTFMLLPARSNSEHIMNDVNRMNTLNTSQALRKKEKHVCPLQFDIIDRAVRLCSNEGDVVVDPFGGISSLNYRCIPLKRKCITIELNEGYWKDGVWYSRKAEALESVPTLFDGLGMEGAA